MLARLALSGLLGTACSPSIASLKVDLDELDLPDSGMVVVLLLPDSADQRARAFKATLPSEPQSLATFEDLEGAPTLFVAAYAVDNQYLPDGELHPLPIAPHLTPLPNPERARGDRMYTTQVIDESVGRWVEDEGTVLPDEIRRLGFDIDVCPCLNLRASVHELGTDASNDSSGLVVALSDDRALVSTYGGSYYELSPNGLKPLDLPVGLPNRTAVRTTSGVVWLFGVGGAAARTSTSAELGFVFAPSEPGRSDIRDAVAVETPTGTIIYTYGSNRISAFDGQRWALVHTEPGSSHWQVSITAVSATEVWTASGRRQTLNRLHNIELDFDAATATSELEVVSPSEALGQNFGALEWLPPLGLVTGAEAFGEIFAGDHRGFSKLPVESADLRSTRGDRGAPTRLGTRAYGFAKLAGGFFGVGALGASVQYHPGFGFCNFDRFSTDGVTKLARVGDNLVMLTEHETRPTNAIYLENQGRSTSTSLCMPAPE